MTQNDVQSSPSPMPDPSESRRPWFRRPCFWLGLLLFVTALALRVAYVVEYSNEIQIDYYTFDQTDNHTFHQWARSIAKGDWLCRDQIHPHHKWTAEVASEEQWHDWYGGQEVYHQAPLYPYIVGLLYALFDYDVFTIKLFQAIMGAATALLAFLTARHFFGRWTGFLAGALVAFSGFHFYYDAFILREGLITFLAIAFLFFAAKAFASDRKLIFFIAGLVLGLGVTAKPNAMLLVPIYLVALLIQYRKEAWVKKGLRIAVFSMGVVLPILPFSIRNVMLDCPALKLSTRGPTAFINGNLKGQSGTDWSPPPAETRKILYESNYDLKPVIVKTLKSYIEEPSEYVGTLWNKTKAFLGRLEIPNNTNYYLIRMVSKTLDVACVSFWFLASAALTGMLLLLPALRRCWQLYTVTIILSLATIAFFIVARFRQPIVPLFAVFAAYAVIWFLKRLRHGRWLPAGAAIALFALCMAWTNQESQIYESATSAYSGVMKKLIAQQEFSRAERYRDKLFIEFAKTTDNLYRPNIQNRFRKVNEAFSLFTLGSFYEPDHAQRFVYYAEGYYLIMESTKRIEFDEYAEYTRGAAMKALELDPEVRGAWKVLGMSLAEQVRRKQEMPWGEKFRMLAKAAMYFKNELEKHPDEIDCLQYLASAQICLGNYADALPLYLQYLKRADEWDFEVVYQIAVILAAQPDPPLALRKNILSMAEDLYDRNPRDLRFGRLYADALVMNKKTAKAKEIFKELIQRDPEDAELYNERLDELKGDK